MRLFTIHRRHPGVDALIRAAYGRAAVAQATARMHTRTSGWMLPALGGWALGQIDWLAQQEQDRILDVRHKTASPVLTTPAAASLAAVSPVSPSTTTSGWMLPGLAGYGAAQLMHWKAPWIREQSMNLVRRAVTARTSGVEDSRADRIADLIGAGDPRGKQALKLLTLRARAGNRHAHWLLLATRRALVERGLSS